MILALTGRVQFPQQVNPLLTLLDIGLRIGGKPQVMISPGAKVFTSTQPEHLHHDTYSLGNIESDIGDHLLTYNTI